MTTHNPGTEPAAAPAPRRRARPVLFLITAVAGLVAVGVLTLAVRNAGGGAPGHAAARPVAAQPIALPPLENSGQAGTGQGGSGQVSLAGYAGQPVIVNFFASWCGPCQKETPLLAGFYASHHGQVKVIGVDSNDTTAAALKFVHAQHVSYPVGTDPFPARAATQWGVGELPQTFFLNARHQIVKHIFGGVTTKELNAWAASLH